MKTANDVKHVAILGAGTMGPGMAQIFAMGGRKVTMWTRSEETRKKAEDALRSSVNTFVEEGLLSKEKSNFVLESISFQKSVEEAVACANFVMETIVENKDAKIQLFKEIDEYLKEDVILASNTSALNVFELVPSCRLKQMVIAHWYAPPQLIPLVEVVKSAEAPDVYADITMELLNECGKTPVFMKKFIRGYIANRMQMCLNQEIFYLLDNDFCTPEDIDKAVKASFIPRAVVLGLCKRIDFGGLDMTANNYKNKSYTLPPEVDIPVTLAKHIENGETGFKTGKGFYDYTGVDKQALLTKRDRQLFEVFKLAKKFMDDPV